tara:strand:- start:435 stop:1694 length:1260 start_codon:yes stop_codon:yes gene_type:complete
MPGPYEGLKVIEFGRFIAAPYCGQLFADGGADVVKVEPLNGDDARRNGTRLSTTEARQFLNKNRGKRSIAVKLSDPRIIKVLRHLAKSADVIISNFRPGQGEELGLDYHTVAKDNPRIIYAENSAYGNKGPLAGQVGMDLLLQARTGLAEITPDGPKYIEDDPVIDYMGGMLMSWGISSALYHRERTGHGQKLDVSLLQAALVLQNNSINHLDQVDGWRHGFVDYLKDAFAKGVTLEEILDERAAVKPPIVPAYYGFFKTSDGYIAIASGGRALQMRTAKLLGVDDPAIDDINYRPDDYVEYTRQMREKSSAALAGETTDHWLQVFEEAGLPAGPLQFKDQVLDDPQCWENDYLVRLDHEEVGGMTVVAPPVKFSESPLSTTTASPVLGKHSREILAEAGLSNDEVEALFSDNIVYENA